MNDRLSFEQMNEYLKCLRDDIRRTEKLIAFLTSLTNGDVLFLTGSRSFGTHSAFSDYDFFMSKDEFDKRSFERILVDELGFYKETPETYMRNREDTSSAAIYRFNEGSPMFLIDIQVIKPEFFEAKKKAQKIIEAFASENPNRFRSYGKYERSRLWVAAIRGEELPKL